MRISIPDGAPGPHFLGPVGIEGSTDPVQVVFVRRDGFDLLVRQMDPCDPEQDPIPVFDGDEVTVCLALSHTSLNTNEAVGDNSGFLFGMRIVEVRRDDDAVYARTLRWGEPDDGRRVHVYPGQQVKFEEGSIVAEINHIDDLQDATSSGFVTLTPVLLTWFSFGQHQADGVRYLLAAARRLDSVNFRLIDVDVVSDALNAGDLAGPAIRSNVVRLISDVESAMIALGRAVDMVTRCGDLLGSTVPVPPLIAHHGTAVTAVRNAYEHIEDRALGQVRQKPHPNALSIFDHARLLAADEVVYDGHVLNIKTDVPAIMAEVRQFLKAAAGET